MFKRGLMAVAVLAIFAGFAETTWACPSGPGYPCTGVGVTTTQKCQATLIKSLAWYQKSGALAINGKCENARICGNLPLCDDCSQDPAYLKVVGRGKVKVRSSVAKFCGPFTLSDISAPTECPGFAGKCRFPIYNTGDLGECIICLGDTKTNHLIRATDGFFHTVVADRPATKCRQSILRFAIGTYVGKPKSPSTICKACGGADKVCGGADDFSPARIGYTDYCQGGGECNMAIESVSDIIDCAQCTAHLLRMCSVSAPVGECFEVQEPQTICDAATPAPTGTPVPTATALPTSTATSTKTPTPTATPTKTATATVTATWTPVPTATKTVTPTCTATVTVTQTATCTPTPTATVTPPMFPYCESLVPPGDHSSNHDGYHQIVGEEGRRWGDDDVYSFHHGNYVQCYCDTETGQGIQTSWWESDLSEFAGWPFRVWGADGWNLGAHWYLAQNRDYQCAVNPTATATPVPTRTATATKTPTPTVTATPVCDCSTLAASLTLEAENVFTPDGTPQTKVTAHGSWNQCGPAVGTLWFGLDDKHSFFGNREVSRGGSFPWYFYRMNYSQRIRVELNTQTPGELCVSVAHVTVPAR